MVCVFELGARLDTPGTASWCESAGSLPGTGLAKWRGPAEAPHIRCSAGISRDRPAGCSRSKPFRHAGQLLSLQSLKELAHGGLADDLAKLQMVRRDVLAESAQRLGRGHINTATDGHFFMRDRNVEAAAAGSSLPRERSSNVILVGRLVFAEAGVAINPVDRLVRDR